MRGSLIAAATLIVAASWGTGIGAPLSSGPTLLRGANSSVVSRFVKRNDTIYWNKPKLVFGPKTRWTNVRWLAATKHTSVSLSTTCTGMLMEFSRHRGHNGLEYHEVVVGINSSTPRQHCTITGMITSLPSQYAVLDVIVRI